MYHSNKQWSRNCGHNKPPYGVAGANISPAGYPTQVSPAQIGPAGGYPSQVSPAQLGPAGPIPTQVAPTQVSPTQQYVNTNIFKTVVPHVHPSHTTTVNKHIIQHQHHFPHTQSVVNECCEENIICPPYPRPRRPW
ncbi:hypothetical protein J9303_17585 [Bacillaceae bacterium Marseille-Q3522]|nr:hypothetical protein [Bacillaceae bacterium Marseille-Q3522]